MITTFIFSRINRINLFERLFPLALIFSLAFGQVQGTESTEISELYPDVKRGSNFYVGKIKGRNLWAVMEHINDKARLSNWLTYINVQYDNHKLGRMLQRKDGKAIMPGFSKDGCEYFWLVLQEAIKNFQSKTDEIWVAYITTNPNPMPITAYENTRITNYDASYLPGNQSYDPNKFPGNILMYVTVTSSPNALITSHMGVSVSLEGIEQRKDGIGDRISMDLHSFAAKVMLMRNPNKKYMVNAPVEAMEKLIAQGLPLGSFFAGTREMQEKIEKAKKITFDDFKNQNINMQEKEIQAENFLKEAVKNFNNSVMYLNEDHRDAILSDTQYETELEKFVTYAKSLHLNISNDYKFSLAENSIKNYIIKDIEDRYKKRLVTYGFTGWPGAQTIDELMKNYPPLLSVDAQDTKSINKRMTIFDRDASTQPWLTIEKGNPDYNWIFSSPFAPGGGTHYIAVDLKDLADSK